MQDKIQEIMGAVDYYNGATTWGTTEQQMAARAALESKLRELVSEPLTEDERKELISDMESPEQLILSVERIHNIF